MGWECVYLSIVGVGPGVWLQDYRMAVVAATLEQLGQAANNWVRSAAAGSQL